MPIDWNLAESKIPIAEYLERRGDIVREVPPRQVGDTFRGSSLGYMCPRQEVLCAIYKVWREDVIDPGLSFIFALGHGIHDALQQSLLKDILVGAWRCRGCGATYGTMEEPVAMPKACTGGIWDAETETVSRCPNHNYYEDVVLDWHLPGFDYKEIDLHLTDPVNLYSHPDGILWRGAGDPPQDLTIDNPYLEVGEFKSANWISIQYGYGKHDPIMYDALPYHRDQCMLYMDALGIERGRLIYVDKSGRGILSSFTEHLVKLDKDHVRDNILGMFESIEEGIETENPECAKRVCKSKSTARARACPVRKQCWGLKR